MRDSSWDNGPGPTANKGLSVWGKVAIGCGTAVLCFVLAVGSLTWWGVNKASSAMDTGWAELHRAVECLRSEAGTRALYRANPGLAQEYPTEKAFLQAAARWRPSLGEVPAQRPDLKALLDSQRGGGFSLKTHYSGGRKLLWMRLRMSTGATLVIEREGEKLTDLRVDGV